MEDAGTFDGEKQSRYALFIYAMYLKKLNGLNIDNTFLVVEPVLHIANPDSNYKCVGTEYIASWYGYVKGNYYGNHREVGNAWSIRDRFSNIANGFRVTKTEYLTTEMQTTMFNVLGVKVPTELYKITSGSSIAYGDGSYMDTTTIAAKYNFHYETNGFAMQTFWLKGTSTGTPIDTFDITTNPQNTPSNAEPPSKDNQTDGDKSIIKLYVDLYKDPNTGYYTQIVDKSQFVQKKVSDKVTITNEENINGYKVSAWYISNTEYNSLPL